MFSNTDTMQIVITPQIYVPFDPNQSLIQPEDHKLIQSEIPMIWAQDGANFRLDITLPRSSDLKILFPTSVESLHINGGTVWSMSRLTPQTSGEIQVEMISSGLQLICTMGGALHILATFAGKSETTRNEVRNGAN